MGRKKKEKPEKISKRKVSVLNIKFPKPVQMEIKKKIDMHSKMGDYELIKACAELAKTKGMIDPQDSGAFIMKHTKTTYQEILDIPCGFDIEVTKVPQYSKKGKLTGYRSYMYIWQMVLDHYLITGRTWEEWHFTMNMIQKSLNLYTREYDEPMLNKNGDPVRGDNGEQIYIHHKESRNILMWIANSSFEFQYISSHQYEGLNIIEDCFSDKQRCPIKFGLNFTGRPSTYEHMLFEQTNYQGAGFTVYDTLRVAGGNLANVAKNYCVTKKAVGDLDYDIPRNSMTPLDDKEMTYIYNDVIILYEWSRFYFDSYMRQSKIMPMTATGIIREAVKYNFKKIDNAKDTKGQLSSWIIPQHPPTIEEYLKAVLLLYRGGYTHANIKYVGQMLDSVRGMDFTSSYPAVMLQCLYPVSPFVKEDIFTEDMIEEYSNKYVRKKQTKCWKATITFFDVQPTSSHSMEAVSKVHEYINMGCNRRAFCEKYNAIIDNNKILYCQQMTVTITEQDWESYKEFYTWDVLEVIEFESSDAGYLPSYLTDVIKEMYKRKSLLKKKKMTKTIDYSIAKAFVNGLYGLTVQKLHFEDIDFDNDEDGLHWATTHKQFDEDGNEVGKAIGKLSSFEISEAWDELYKGMITDFRGQAKLVLSPYYGIWCTAHARRRILQAIWYLGEDAVYSDTDSVYFLNWEKHKAYFEKWNEDMENLNRELFGDDFDDLGDLGTFDPVAIEHDDGESIEYHFETLGAKRYIKYDDDDNMEITIAGLPKESLYKAGREMTIKICEETGVNVDLVDMKRETRVTVCDLFIPDMNIIRDYADKKTHSYADTPHSDVVTDEHGNTETMTESSSLSIFNIGFNMTLETEWYKLAKYILEDSRRICDYRTAEYQKLSELMYNKGVKKIESSQVYQE